MISRNNSNMTTALKYESLCRLLFLSGVEGVGGGVGRVVHCITKKGKKKEVISVVLIKSHRNSSFRKNI